MQAKSIPFGYCQCGCGEKTDPAKGTDSRKGLVKGRPTRFINHHFKRSIDPKSASGEHFWAKVDKGGPIPEHRPELGPCWVWTGPTTMGYGMAYLPLHKSITAHRAAWILTHPDEPIPEGMWVLHKCDFKPCCRPSHLFLGTHDDNMADMVSKDRQAKGERHISRTHPERLARGDRNGSRLHPESRPRGEAHAARRIPGLHAGERNGRAKVTEAQVREIKRRLAAGPVNQRHLAAEMGISPTAISHIARGKTWTNITIE